MTRNGVLLVGITYLASTAYALRQQTGAAVGGR